MRINLIFILFYLIVGCSPKVDLALDIENLKKEGTTILQNKHLGNKQNILKISKLITYPIKINTNWTYPNYNSQNLPLHSAFEAAFSINKKKNYFENVTNNYYQKIVLKINNNIVFIDDYSNLIILNDSLELIKKFKIHKDRYYKNYPLKFSLVSDGKNLFVADNLGSIFAYELNNYKEIWRNDLEVPFLSNLSLFKNSIFVSNSNGKIYSFDIFTGKPNWSYETGTQTAKSHKAYKLSIIEDKLLFSNDFGTIACVDLTLKKIIWSSALQSSSIYNDSNLLELADFVAENKAVYIASNLGKFIKVDLSSGSILWSNDAVSTTAPIINRDTVALVEDNGFFNVYAKDTGKVLYKKNILNSLRSQKIEIENIKVNNFFLASGSFYITTQDGYVFSVNSTDLQSVQHKKIAEKINSNIAFSKKNIFFIANKSEIIKSQ